jgi:hypothetical protein
VRRRGAARVPGVVAAPRASTAVTGFSVVDVALHIDGTLVASAGFRRLFAANSTGLMGAPINWSMGVTRSLPAGSHDIAVHASLANGSSAVVSGGSSTTTQGALS